MRATHNILVISDLHLGEDLNPSATEETTRDLDLAERQLIEFLRKYTHRRADGLPWRLVVNGDMADFLTITVFPGEHSELSGLEFSADERNYGLDRRKDAACIQLDALIARHAEFFRSLARFLAAGNALEIISGNHDTEFYWAEVQDRFRLGVIEAWKGMPASSRPGAATAEQIRDAIGFHAWFYYEPGVAWIEHGHQYDECCSFEYNLNPVGAGGKAIVPNIDTAGLRYVTNQIPEANPHGTEEWSFKGYVRFASGLGWRGVWRLLYGYYLFVATLIAEWRKARVGGQRRRRRAIHQRELARLSQSTSIDHETLQALDEMQRPPVITNLRRLMQVLMLDKVAVSLVALLAIVAAVMWLPLVWALPFAAAAVGATHLANEWLGRGRMVDASLPLQIVPMRILEHVDARYVIFGHTHLPIAQRLAGDEQGERWYYNTGTWVPSERPGILRAFTHVVIRQGSSGPQAALCQWRDGASRQFTPDWKPVETPELAPVPARTAAELARAA